MCVFATPVQKSVASGSKDVAIPAPLPAPYPGMNIYKEEYVSRPHNHTRAHTHTHTNTHTHAHTLWGLERTFWSSKQVKKGGDGWD